MNISINGKEASLYAGANCGFCGRTLPEKGECACGVWQRTLIPSPVYLITLTKNAHALVNTPGYYSKQYQMVKEEQNEKHTH